MKSTTLYGAVCTIMFVLLSCIPVLAGDVSSDMNGVMTADNHYLLYISTNDSEAGTLIGQSYRVVPGDTSLNDPDTTSPYDWKTIERAWNFSLTPGVTNYLHIAAYDTGVKAGLLGQFTLSNSNFYFNGGASTLLTGLNGWTVREGGFNGGLLALTAPTVNGGSPWGLVPDISSDARWIWTNDGNDVGSPEAPLTRYFSAKINAVPEPISAGLFLLGGSALAVIRRKRA